MNSFINTNIIGTLSVFPTDRGRLTKKKKPYEEQTIVLNLSKDYVHYYNNMFYKKYGILLEPSPFGSHITVNNGIDCIVNKDTEEIKEYLNSINNKKITVNDCPTNIYIHWRFIAIPVFSKELNDIRIKLGLSPKRHFHITIGKVKDKDIHFSCHTYKNEKQIDVKEYNRALSLDKKQLSSSIFLI